ncbi:hypothetical protein BH09SUM1_BH09SUM1_17870 [soil metagenome]
MKGFWILTSVSIAIISAVMLTIAHLARDVPEKPDAEGRQTRMDPELLRIIAYAIMIIIALLTAMYELSLHLPGSAVKR